MDSLTPHQLPLTRFIGKESRNGPSRDGANTMKISDALSILGLSSGATQDEIKSAYKGAAKKYHPDLNPAGAEMMKLVNAAFDVLRDATSTQTQEDSDCNYGEECCATIWVRVQRQSR
ncbi:J domain-containing protein [Pseudovibrio ascidiaceicola]|uniref:J domain-containing protein n=1 Tax=Pseudovibrio ascidiaceicola TaxID=285279 RepID=UPI003D36870D